LATVVTGSGIRALALLRRYHARSAERSMIVMRLLILAGSRKNLLKAGPIIAEAKKYPQLSTTLVYAGDAADQQSLEHFSRGLSMPKPHIVLRTHAGSGAAQTASVISRIHEVISESSPDLILVVGDVDSALVASLNAVRTSTPIARVEAGLRAFDREDWEEINRVMSDATADLFYVGEKSAARNLLCEGVPRANVCLIGSILVDTLLFNAAEILRSEILSELSLSPGDYSLLVLEPRSGPRLETGPPIPLRALESIQRHIPVVFPAEMETVARLHRLGVWGEMESMSKLTVIDQLGYADLMKLTKEARFILTNSGELQEETTAMKVPCLTLLKRTLRPITVAEGSNTLVGTALNRIVPESLRIVDGPPERGRTPGFWDGRASSRLIRHLLSSQDRIRRLCRATHESDPCIFIPAQLG
jgi:UDP-N-acetylglucosamine 2-epimerase (non-hydrolysing)